MCFFRPKLETWLPAWLPAPIYPVLIAFGLNQLLMQGKKPRNVC